MYLVVFYRENNEKHFVYHLNTTDICPYEVGELNGFGWLVIAKTILYDGYFYYPKKYYSLLLKKRENDLIEYRKQAIKREKRNKIISILEIFRNGI